MPVEQLRVPIGRTINDPETGFKVSVRKIVVNEPNPGPTDYHEAAHVVVAEEIDWAKSTPDGRALGVTKPKRMTAAVAGAAAAMGHGGVGWDLYVVAERGLGVDASSAIAQGAAALSGKGDEVKEVAILLKQHGTIYQSHVHEARNNVRKHREGIHPVEVLVSSPHGGIKIENRESFRGQVDISIDVEQSLEEEKKQAVAEAESIFTKAKQRDDHTNSTDDKKRIEEIRSELAQMTRMAAESPTLERNN